jgi:hypothetical protein
VRLLKKPTPAVDEVLDVISGKPTWLEALALHQGCSARSLDRVDLFRGASVGSSSVRDGTLAEKSKQDYQEARDERKSGRVLVTR